MTSTAAKLRAMPELKALEAVYSALTPLKPEGRRKVIEAIHALLEISAGVAQKDPAQAAKSRKAK